MRGCHDGFNPKMQGIRQIRNLGFLLNRQGGMVYNITNGLNKVAKKPASQVGAGTELASLEKLRDSAPAFLLGGPTLGDPYALTYSPLSTLCQLPGRNLMPPFSYNRLAFSPSHGK